MAAGIVLAADMIPLAVFGRLIIGLAMLIFVNRKAEEYAAADLVIDGESCKNVAIRAKGSTSLSSVAQYGNDRYSYKVEFDHYDSSITYHGLDKLSLKTSSRIPPT